MELQNTSPNLTSRESVQKKIANALDYLGENYNIVDKSVREGDATTMDIARSFTGDVKSDKLSENIGLLDFTPLGTYFAAEEGQDAINKAEPNAFKRQMALLNYLRQPLQTIIDRPDIGLPATDIALGGIEAIPFGYVVTKPIKGFFKSLKAKATEPSKDVGMITQQTSLPTSSDVSTTTVPVKNEEINQSRRKFLKDTGTVGTVGALGMLGTQVPDAIKMVEKAIVPNTIKKGEKLMKPINLQSAQKLFSRPLVKSYLRDMAEDNMLVETMKEILYDRVPDYQKSLIDGDSTAFFEEAYDIKDIEKLTLDEIMSNEKLVNDLSIDVGGDETADMLALIRRNAINDGAKPKDIDVRSDEGRLSQMELLQTETLMESPLEGLADRTIKEAKNVVEEYYNNLKESGLSPQDIYEKSLEGRLSTKSFQ
jgi:hypothetical protein